jgi:polar amino acid transport system substrate-binding protein
MNSSSQYGAMAALCLAIGTLGAGAATADDCKPAHQLTTVVAGVITVAPGTYPPYSYVDSSGELQGIDGDILKAIAKLECDQVKAIPVDPAAALQYVISGKADLTSGDWYRTEARERVTNLSDPLYLDQMAVYSRTGADTVDSLMNHNVASTQGNLWIADVQKLLGDRLKLYQVAPAALQDLENGRIDIVLDGYSVGVLAQSQGKLKDIQIKVIKPDPRVGASMEAGQGAFPINKKNTALLDALNADIATLHKDGTIAKILTKFGLDPSAAETGAPRLIK